MTQLQWDQTGERLFETGTDKGVLFPTDDTGAYVEGVAWNGLTAVKQAPDGAEPTDLFADNRSYVTLESAENFKGSIEAYTSPEEFDACDGSAEIVPGVTIGQQGRSQFGMAYRTLIGNDVKLTSYGEKIHIIYGARVAPSARDYETVNADPAAITLSWEFTTSPVSVEGYRPTAYVCVDSTKVTPEIMKTIKDMIYGTDAKPAKLIPLAELITLIKPAG